MGGGASRGQAAALVGHVTFNTCNIGGLMKHPAVELSELDAYFDELEVLVRAMHEALARRRQAKDPDAQKGSWSEVEAARIAVAKFMDTHGFPPALHR
jgi:hypothetical protein